MFTGVPKPLGDKKKISSIVKDPVNEIIISKSEIHGDMAADVRHHGGPDRVIHHYSQIHYSHLKSKFPEHASLFNPGSYGENLFTDEIQEKELYIGDVFKLGTSLIQLTEPRDPCGTIDLRYGFRGVLKEILKTRRYGWFYRVLEEGKASRGDYLELIDRPYPELNLDQFIYEANQNRQKDLDFLTKAAECPALSQRYLKKIKKML